MAKYYSLTYGTAGADMRDALQDYYGSGVTVHKTEVNSVVFSCPQICDLYMKLSIVIPSTNWPHVMALLSVSSTLTTDGSLDGGVAVNASQALSSAGNKIGEYMVLADRFILIQTNNNNSDCNYSVLIARATNNRTLFVTGGRSTKFSSSYCMYADSLVATPIRFLFPLTSGFESDGKLVMLPSCFASEYEMELNADGSFAHVEGLWCCSKALITEPVVGSNYYIGISLIRAGNVDGIYANGSFFVELEADA